MYKQGLPQSAQLCISCPASLNRLRTLFPPPTARIPSNRGLLWPTVAYYVAY
jgi:hypothetical protein